MSSRHSSNTGSQQQRNELALEAAKLMIHGGIESFDAVRRKLATRHHIHAQALLPRDSEIERALQDHQRLFGGPAPERELRNLRKAAIEAMQALRAFEPRLTGAVLDGTATATSPISLHVFSDEAESVIHFLSERGIPFRDGSRALRFGDQQALRCTTLSFASDAAEFRLTVIPLALQNVAPLGSPGEPPARRADLRQLQRLLEHDSNDIPG